MKKKNCYTFFWLTGRAEVLKGNNPATCMNNAGYSSGALRALDFYSPGDVADKWEWDKVKRTWNQKVTA